MTDKERQDILKHRIIHMIIEYAEEESISRQEVSTVLCQLSKEVQDGFGNVFCDDEIKIKIGKNLGSEEWDRIVSEEILPRLCKNPE